MKYKLTKINNPDKFCSQIDFNGTILYLLEDENGKTLQELAEPFYNTLLLLMNYNSLIEINKTTN